MSAARDAGWQAAQRWLASARQQGWLGADAASALERLEREGAGGLFEAGTLRPLVVAFFGGTGVGKSSLLNRLAGETVARTGVERPTSHELTVYAHDSLPIDSLQAHFPAAFTRVARHRHEARREVMWVDMPDIDSTATANRALAESWLPYTDLLVYVVSPERYRDDVGWRLMSRRSHRHGWVFVMNHWDEASPEQLEDFASMLRASGFDEPLILRSCCPPGHCEDDDFGRLVTLIQDLQARQIRSELERLGELARLDELAALIRRQRSVLGSEDDWQALHTLLGEQWQAAQTAIVEAAGWPIAQAAASYARHEDSGSRRWWPLVAARGSPAQSVASQSPVAANPAKAAALWDDWAEARVRRALDACEVQMQRAGIAVHPVLDPLRSLLAAAEPVVSAAVGEGLRTALAKPGSALQRAARRLSGVANMVLPLVAMGWVAVHVVRSFYRGVAGEGAFLGGDFAIHSALLVLLAWLLPMALKRALRPSLQGVAAAGLRSGLVEALRQLREDMAARMARTAQARAGLDEQACALLAELEAARRAEPPRSADLQRLVARRPAVRD